MVIRTTQDKSLNLMSHSYAIPTLPLSIELETKHILKKSREASGALAELKGFAHSVPNQDILINTLSLQEAKDSSAIENIITTHDQLFQNAITADKFENSAAKEVHRYASALRNGFYEIQRTKTLTNNLIKKIQSEVEGNNAGFRKQSGTTLKNEQTGQTIYTPPQHYDKIVQYMTNLEKFINNDALSDWDDLIKMAIIHHQFESIHPFFDGNGRTGRIINILYLTKQGLLDTPILYLSRYINQNKPEYYRLLQTVRQNGVWEEWVIFILEGVRQTSYQTIKLIAEIKKLMQDYKFQIRTKLPKIYSQDLLNNLFNHPYTKITLVEQQLQVTRPTATKYLNALVKIGIVSKHKLGRQSYYLNDGLFDLLHKVNAPPTT